MGAALPPWWLGCWSDLPVWIQAGMTSERPASTRGRKTGGVVVRFNGTDEWSEDWLTEPGVASR
jgi:hypothetical protein